MGRLFWRRTTRAAVLGTNDKETSHAVLTCGYFLSKDASPCPASRFQTPGEPSRRRQVPKVSLVPATWFRFRTPSPASVITARDSLKHVRCSAPNFAARSGCKSPPPRANVRGWTRISSAQEPLRPMPLPRPSRVNAARRSDGAPHTGVRHAATTGWHALHAALPAKSGRTRPPLPIPSATRPSTQRAPPQPPRARRPKPQR